MVVSANTVSAKPVFACTGSALESALESAPDFVSVALQLTLTTENGYNKVL